MGAGHNTHAVQTLTRYHGRKEVAKLKRLGVIVGVMVVGGGINAIAKVNVGGVFQFVSLTDAKQRYAI